MRILFGTLLLLVGFAANAQEDRDFSTYIPEEPVPVVSEHEQVMPLAGRAAWDLMTALDADEVARSQPLTMQFKGVTPAITSYFGSRLQGQMEHMGATFGASVAMPVAIVVQSEYEGETVRVKLHLVGGSVDYKTEVALPAGETKPWQRVVYSGEGYVVPYAPVDAPKTKRSKKLLKK